VKIADELRPDGSTRYKVQHRDPQRPGKYTTKRFDDKNDAAEFVRRAKIELADALAWDSERRGGVSFRGQAGRTFIAYAADYIRGMTDAKEKTRTDKLNRLRGVARVESFAALQMGAITHADIESFKRQLSELRPESHGGELLKSRTKNGYLEIVLTVIRHAAAVGDIPRDVSAAVKKFRVDDAKQTCPITIPEFDSILVHVRQPERRALFRLLIDSGLRISEALALRWEDFREVAGGIYEIRVWELNAAHGKTSHAQRITTVPAETFKLIPSNNDPHPFTDTYNAISGEWRRAVQRAQAPAHAKEFAPLMKSPTIHDLRHSHAAYLITACGLNLALVAERLGHRDIGITQRYYGRLVTEQAHELGVLIARNIPRGVTQ
jgi:integrase